MQPIVVTAVLIVFLVVVGGLFANGTRNVRLQDRALTAARESGAGFLCLPEFGQAGRGMWLLSVDHQAVTVRAGWRRKPDRVVTLPSAGATVGRAPVQVNLLRTIDGVLFRTTDGRSLMLALYPDPTLGRSNPLADFDLDDAISTLRWSVG